MAPRLEEHIKWIVVGSIVILSIVALAAMWFKKEEAPADNEKPRTEKPELPTNAPAQKKRTPEKGTNPAGHGGDSELRIVVEGVDGDAKVVVANGDSNTVENGCCD